MLINANLSYAYEYQASEILACILQMVLTLKDRFRNINRLYYELQR